MSRSQPSDLWQKRTLKEEGGWFQEAEYGEVEGWRKAKGVYFGSRTSQRLDLFLKMTCDSNQ